LALKSATVTVIKPMAKYFLFSSHFLWETNNASKALLSRIAYKKKAKAKIDIP
jgi:hypothetical protein